MTLKSYTQWKELLIVEDEIGNNFCFMCGWGVEPPVAYIPPPDDWAKCVPEWLRERRDEVIDEMKKQKHLVEEWEYPTLKR
jgi:hypothetical protein